MKINYLIWHSIKSQLWFKTHNDEKIRIAAREAERTQNFITMKGIFFPCSFNTHYVAFLF